MARRTEHGLRSRKPAAARGDGAAVKPPVRTTDEQPPVTNELIQELRQLREENERLRSFHEFREPAVAGVECHDGVCRILTDELRDERKQFAEQLPVPGRDAPTFNLINDYLACGVTPWADPLVPAYLLDKNYRILDWNTAFSLAYDRTMEGRRGMSVLEWVYFLDNYEECLTRGTRDFADPANLPRLHVEKIHYTSPRYGKIVATKRAYQMPRDDGDMLGWLVTLETEFADLATTLRFKRDLFATLRRDLTWSEYALSYDRVLMASNVYRELLDHILGERMPAGEKPVFNRIQPRSRVLDLGAGTGNLSLSLANQQRGHVVFAVENNRMMLDMLRAKCDRHLRSDDCGSGILAIKQDVNTLFGIPDDSFDYAILNNVVYSLEDPMPCLRQVRRALRPQGEIRVSGPQRKTKLDQLFARIAADLKESGKFTEVQADFDRVWEINRAILGPSLYRWTVAEMEQMLRTAGFGEITYSTETAYSGQAMIVVATGGGRR